MFGSLCTRTRRCNRVDHPIDAWEGSATESPKVLSWRGDHLLGVLTVRHDNILMSLQLGIILHLQGDGTTDLYISSVSDV